MPPETTGLQGRALQKTCKATEESLSLEHQLPRDSVQKGSSMKSISTSPVTLPDQRLIITARSAIVLLAFVCYVHADIIQGWVDTTWQYLLTAWWFQSVYFETVWATLCYAYIIPLYPFTMHYIPLLDRYKVDKSTTYVHQTVLGILVDAVVYMAPLALMDTFMVKKYCGADPQEWIDKRQSWIQTTRPLPLEPPSVLQIFYQVFGSVLIYDVLFFFIHLVLHKYRPLYSLFHKRHHDHDIMHAHVTNQLSVGERIMLILAANQALKILYSHPLSRALFVPVFIWLLVDNHSGYDLPLGLQHLVPGNLWGGPRLHYAHHILGTRHYQPFMTYMDCALEWWEGRRCQKQS